MFKFCLLGLCLLLIQPYAFADNVDAQVASVESENNVIPFKQDKNLEQQAFPVLFGLLIFFVLVAVFLYYFKDKLAVVKSGEAKNIHVLEIKRLNTKLTLFHVRVKDKEFLVAQSGDSINITDVENKSVSQEL